MAKRSKTKKSRIPKASPIKESAPAPTAAPGDPLPGRVHGFDTLRALATLVILVYHFTTHYDQAYGHLGKILGTPRLNIGVPTFLILSGFLNVMIIQRASSALDWFVGKFVRLYPVYWVACGITYSAVTVFMLPGREVSLHDALINLTMIQMLLHVPHIDGVYWTLQVVLFFYLIIGTLFAVGLKRALAPIFIGLTALNICGFNRHWLSGMDKETAHILQSVLVLQYVCFFMVGMMIYHMRTRFRLWHLFGVALFMVDIYTSSRWQKSTALYALPVVVFVVSRFRIPGLDNRVFRYLATISYALYVIHQNVGFIVIRKVYSHANGYVAIAVATVFVVALASALTFLVERPVARLLKGGYTRLRSRRAAR